MDLPEKITPDPSFMEEVLSEPDGEMLRYCFNCGTCTASCVVSRHTENYRPRMILHLVSLGARDAILKSKEIWLCAACNTCGERCPQGINIAEAMNVLRRLAIKHNQIPSSVRALASSIVKFGRIYEIDDFIEEERQDLGLPVLPPPDKKFLESLSRKINSKSPNLLPSE
ncbi:MAG: 4Fe-4S dicluster domain-containing protein [Promethearchaeati archaeon SRVP18_Atabeyarchaeia-1]